MTTYMQYLLRFKICKKLVFTSHWKRIAILACCLTVVTVIAQTVFFTEARIITTKWSHTGLTQGAEKSSNLFRLLADFKQAFKKLLHHQVLSNSSTTSDISERFFTVNPRLIGNVSALEGSYKENIILNFIPRAPETSVTDIVANISPNITRQFLEIPVVSYFFRIAILSPVCNVREHLLHFAQELSKLTYPHHLIEVYLGEDNSKDNTYETASLAALQLKREYGFHESGAYTFNISAGVQGSFAEKHMKSKQNERRSHLARVRNLLLKAIINKENLDYILWIDGDVKSWPDDIIQQLLFSKADIVAPSCLFRSDGQKRIFDKNTWRETALSLKIQESLNPDELLVEGYDTSKRIFLPHLRSEGRVVPIDGVGGCVLMVKANCFRKGLIFPEMTYKHHIETEGLAKMAKDMKFTVMGMPFVEVFHS